MRPAICATLVAVHRALKANGIIACPLAMLGTAAACAILSPLRPLRETSKNLSKSIATSQLVWLSSLEFLQSLAPVSELRTSLGAL